eukprot:TRINITY_DN19143_c0_g1_i1.p1 TRINITY_DN19143_c0_g1~~TRINITY_DN19143_c0_g1_i1.p1  ORF type:complete len:166 (+),score=19.17 TRINITY_DN19143_c0_g1_i1:256-753(+)
MQFFGASEAVPAPVPPINRMRCIYMFNRNGVCLFYKEWLRPLTTLSPQQDQKLMFGLLFSLKSFTIKMDPTSPAKASLGVPQLPGQGCSFHSFRTNTYKLHFMESPSGIKLVLVTDPKVGNLQEALRHIYSLYVDYVIKNPLYVPGEPFRFDLFTAELDNYARTL